MPLLPSSTSRRFALLATSGRTAILRTFRSDNQAEADTMHYLTRTFHLAAVAPRDIVRMQRLLERLHQNHILDVATDDPRRRRRRFLRPPISQLMQLGYQLACS